MSQIDKMLEQFKDLSEVQAYASAQYTTILSLNKKIADLQKERDDLKQLLENKSPLLLQDENNKLISSFDISDEEIIAITQIRRLKIISMERAFTKEESGVYDTMNKNLIAIRNAPKTIKIQSDQLTEKELLALIENTNE